uniref:Pancreatic trypsin inhibitor n=1 Tax=Rhipicephalus appendiculatus TaxID=34631 RepID=A0A131YY56_RHIAP
MASIPCFFRKVHVVYIYNQWKKKCMKRYDCSYFGNKFPTLRECQHTCKIYEALRHVTNNTESSSQVSTKREKIISTMAQQQNVSQSAISSAQGSLNSQTSHGQESRTGQESSSAQSSQSVGQSGTQQNSQSSSGIQIIGTGAGQASSTSSSSHVSGQISKSDLTGSEQGGQSTSGMAGGSGLTGNEIVAATSFTGGAQHGIESSTTSRSQQSRQVITSQSSLSQQTSQSHTGSSAVSNIETDEIRTGGGQQNTISGTTGNSESSNHIGHNGLTESGQHGSSASGSSSGSGLVGHQVVTGGQELQINSSGASSSRTSNQISSSDTSGSHPTGSSSSGLSVGSNIHGQLQETGGTSSSSSQGQHEIGGTTSSGSQGQQQVGGTTGLSSQSQQQQVGGTTSSSSQGVQQETGSSSQATVQVSGSNMGGTQQSTSSIWNHVTGTHISTTPGHGNYGACRAALQTAYCLFDVYAMYAYDPFAGACFMIYDCSLHGNKFPTLKACKQACVRRVKYPRLTPADQQKILNLTHPSPSTGQSAITGTQILQLPAGAPVLPGSAQVSVSQGKLSTSTQQQATSSQSTLITSQETGGIQIGNGQQSLTGPTEGGKQVSGQGQISAGQATTQQSTVGGGVLVTKITDVHPAQEKHEMDKAVAMDEEWFNQQGKASTLEEQQKILKKLKLPSVKVSKPKLSPYDRKCSITAPTPRTQGCRRQRWYYSKKTKECLPSCSKLAPFSNKIACDGVCRSLEACDFPMASLFCFFRTAHVVYIYNQNSKRCFKGYDCSNFGNKFPTMEECQSTCHLYEEVPKPGQTAASGSGDLAAHVPATHTESNDLPPAGNSATPETAAAVVKTGKK